MDKKKIRLHVMEAMGETCQIGLNTHKRTRQNRTSFHTAYATNEVMEGKM